MDANLNQHLTQLYRELDQQTQILEQVHSERLVCKRGCHACCVDELTVFGVEAAYLQTHAAAVLAEAPHPVGKCAFLDDQGGCRIYAHRPYVCRTQGLPLRWLDELDLDGNPEEEGELFEYRDICPLNETEDPIEELEEEDCWTIGPYEGRLAALEDARSNGAPERIGLRELFHSKP